jgi:hypothetical protein
MAATLEHLSRTQFDALVLGLPWQRLGEAGVITRAVSAPVNWRQSGCTDGANVMAASSSPVITADSKSTNLDRSRCVRPAVVDG